MTNREKFKEIFNKDIHWSRAIEPQILALKSAYIDGINCMEEWLNEEYKELTTKNNLTVDCIDRNSIKYYPGYGGYMYASKGEIDKLPPVTPQEPKIGRWIDCKCDKCGYVVQPWNTTSFCPNCGAKMESEDKE